VCGSSNGGRRLTPSSLGFSGKPQRSISVGQMVSSSTGLPETPGALRALSRPSVANLSTPACGVLTNDTKKENCTRRRFAKRTKSQSSTNDNFRSPDQSTTTKGATGFELDNWLLENTLWDNAMLVGSKYSADHEVQWLPSVRSPDANDSPSNRALDPVKPASQDRTRRSGGESRGRFPRLSQPDVVDLQLKCRDSRGLNFSAEYDFTVG
jgi:hypothetical protein